MRIKLLIAIFLFSILHGQENKNLDYKEDQIYLNFNFDFQLKGIEGYQQNGFSRTLNLGILRDISINKEGNKAIALGFGYGYTRLVNNLDVEDDSYFSIELDSALRNRISFHSIQVPLELRLRTSTLENFAFWRFYLGYRLNYNFSAKYKPFFGRKTSLENNVTEFTHCLSLSIGFNTWNIRFETGLSPIAKILKNSSKNKENFFISGIGLVFYIL